MKIALIGFGKMGKLIAQTAIEQGHEIVSIIDKNLENSTITLENLNNPDVVIDFSDPESIMDNIKALAALKQNMIIGTTGWYENLAEVKQLIEDASIGFLYAPNFSIGVNIFLKIVNYAASLINEFDDYDVGGFEMHHNQKLDSPSGTAKSVAEILLDQIERKESIIYDRVNSKINANEVHYASVRAGSNPGHHTVIFDSDEDAITLTHEARNRAGFAKGALKAALWLNGKKGFYTIHDVIEDKSYA
jgi:4-hydroxy-tetrahydrodipicolinate reductase